MKGRILFLSDTASIHTQRWIRAFAESNYEVTVASLRRDGVTSAYPNIRMHCLANPKFKKAGYLLALPELFKLHRHGNFGLVHAHHLSSYGFLGSWLPRKSPFFVTAWGSDVLIMPQRSRAYHYLARKALERADLIFTTAQNVSDTIPSIASPRAEIKCIPFGVDLQAFAFRAPRQNLRRVELLSNRAFKAIYDITTLIAACAILRGKLDFNLTLAGAGPLEAALRKQVADQGLNGHVKFAGILREPEMPVALWDADIFVTCSLSDANNVSLTEAMAVGTVPVASRITANTPWITDRKNGYLFQVQDAGDLAGAILEAVTQLARWPKIAEENRQIVEARANWRSCVRETFSLYDSRLARPF